MSTTLVRRQWARLWGERTLSIGLALCGLGLVVGGGLVAAISRREGISPEALPGLIWVEGFSFYGMVLSILAIIVGVLQVGSDLRRGTLLPVLARPVSRARVFLAAWTGTVLVFLALEVLKIALGSAALVTLGASMGGQGYAALVADTLGPVTLLALFAALGAALPVPAALGVGLLSQLLPGLAYGGWPYGERLRPICWFLPLTNTQWPTISSGLAGGGDSHRIVEAILYRTCWIALLLAFGCWAFSRRDVSPR